MSTALKATLQSLLAPLALLLAAVFALPVLREAPADLQFLVPLLPYASAALALLVALLLNQARLLCIALLPPTAYWLLSMAQAAGVDMFRAEAWLGACVILLPVNLMFFGMLRERGLFNPRGVLLPGLLVLQGGVLAWVVLAQRTEVVELLGRPFLPVLPAGPVPHAGAAAFLLAGVVLGWRLLLRPTALHAALLLLVPALAVAAYGVNRAAVPEAFLGSAGLILSVGMLLEMHRIAHRDELTGLPARRSLHQRLATPGRRYSIAMLDIDHFKQFNDRYGHEVGDHVLRLVASRLQRVRGGTAYRYGGEEFAIVFPRREIEQVRPQLEAIRQDIADYSLTLRGRDRPRQRSSGRKRRGAKASRSSVNVSVSIGLAARGEKLRRADEVLQAADKALYRAKRAGRNRLKT